jgi:NADH-quinone oxidoreductase subunit J
VTVAVASGRAYWPPSLDEVLMVLLGVLTVGSAVLVVTTRHVVRAALWLVVTFGALAGSYLVLTAELVAWVQVLVYVGAVVVLLLFGVMLTRAPTGGVSDLDSENRPAALLVALAATGTLIGLLVQAFHDTWVDVRHAPPGHAAVLGGALFRHWVLPFEVLSVLLLAALIGAIVLARPEVGATAARDGGEA